MPNAAIRSVIKLYLEMDNANGFLVVLSSATTVQSREPIGGDFSDQRDVVGGRRHKEVEILRPPDFRIGKNAFAQKEPPGSPSFAVIGPLVEDSGHRGLRSSRNAVRSAGRRRSRQTPRSQ